MNAPKWACLKQNWIRTSSVLNVWVCTCAQGLTATHPFCLLINCFEFPRAERQRNRSALLHLQSKLVVRLPPECTLKEASVVSRFVFGGLKPVAQAYFDSTSSRCVQAGLVSVCPRARPLQSRGESRNHCTWCPKSAVLVVCPAQASDVVYWRSAAER